MKIECTKVPVVTDKEECPRESSYLILGVIIVVPHTYNITFATWKSNASHFNICPILFPIVPIVKMVKIRVLLEN